MENALDLESLSREFQFVDRGRQVAEFVSRHPQVEAIWPKSAIPDLQRQLVGHDRELRLLAEANGRARAEQDSQLEGVRGATDEVTKQQRHDCKRVLMLEEAMGEVRRLLEGVAIKLNGTEEAVEQRVGPLERAARGLAETTDRTCRLESDIGGLRAAVTNGSTKVEEVRREVTGVKAQLSDCCPKIQNDFTNMERELAKLKEEIRELGLQKAAMADQGQRHKQEICDVKHEVELLRQASDGQRDSQEREAEVVTGIRKVIGQLAGELEDLRSTNSRDRLALREVGRANEQLPVEGDRVKQRIELLEKKNRRLSEAIEVMKRAVGEVSDESGTGACEAEGGNQNNNAETRAAYATDGRCGCSAGRQGNIPRAEVFKQLTTPIRGSPAAATFASESVTAGSPTPDSSSSTGTRERPSSRPTSSRRPPLANQGPPPPKPTAVKVPPPPAPPKPAKQFPLSVKNGTNFEIPDGIIAHLARE
jgi:hypothetical protein